MRLTVHLTSNGLDVSSTALVGRQVATEGVVRAYLKYEQPEQIGFLGGEPNDIATVESLIQKHSPRTRVVCHGGGNSEAFTSSDCIFVASPTVSNLMEIRKNDDCTYNTARVVGLTHSMSSKRVWEELARTSRFAQPGDALICTSRCVAQLVEQILAMPWSIDSSAALGAPLGYLPTVHVPLGYHAEDFATKSGGITRDEFRRRLGAAETDLVVLSHGRANYVTKMHPEPMFIALERVAQQINVRLFLVISGWFPSAIMASQTEAMHKRSAKSVHVVTLDGRVPSNRNGAWLGADIFLSLVDNVQESFGLTPVEAMAVGLPCVISDWNGYKETVRDGIDGYRIATVFPPSPCANALIERHRIGQISHEQCTGILAQATSFDMNQAVSCILKLASDRTLREQMGQEGKRHALTHFEWSVLIRHYLDVFAGREPFKPQGVHDANKEKTLAPFSEFATTMLTRNTRVRVAKVTPPSFDEILACASRRILPDDVWDVGLVRTIVKRTSKASYTTVSDIAAEFSQHSRNKVEFGIAFLLKFGFFEIG